MVDQNQKFDEKIILNEGVYAPSSFNFFYEFLDLGPSVNAPAYYKSLIFMYNVTLNIKITLFKVDFLFKVDIKNL